MKLAGLDWSGPPFPDATSYLYIPCVVAVDSLEELNAALDRARRIFGMSAREEFRGHQSSERMQATVLEIAADMQARIAAVLYDKRIVQVNGETITLPSNRAFPAAAALSVLERFLPTCQIRSLWCDEDIQGKKRQQEFNTAVQRIHRAAWPGMHLKVRHRASDDNDLIQLADITAYALSRVERSLVESPELKRHVEAIRSQPRSVIIGPRPWGK